MEGLKLCVSPQFYSSLKMNYNIKLNFKNSAGTSCSVEKKECTTASCVSMQRCLLQCITKKGTTALRIPCDLLTIMASPSDYCQPWAYFLSPWFAFFGSACRLSLSVFSTFRPASFHW